MNISKKISQYFELIKNKLLTCAEIINSLISRQAIFDLKA